MNARNIQKLVFPLLIAGLALNARPAFAANWWDSLFSSNQNSTSTATPSASTTTAATPGNFADDRAEFRNDNRQMHDLYQKMWQNKQAGIDTTADQQAISDLQAKINNSRNQLSAERQHNLDSVASSRKSVADTIAKLNADKAAGLDTTADEEALKIAKNTLRADEQKARQDGAGGMRGQGYGNQNGPGPRGGWNQNHPKNAFVPNNGNWNNASGSAPLSADRQHDLDSVASSRKSVADTIAKLNADKAAGLDTTADEEALKIAQNTLRADQQKARQNGAGGMRGPGSGYGNQRWNNPQQPQQDSYGRRDRSDSNNRRDGNGGHYRRGSQQ